MLGRNRNGLFRARDAFDAVEERFLFAFLVPALEDRRDDRTHDVVPEGAQRSRGGRKVHRGEGYRETGVLHADLKAEALALGEIHAGEASGPVAEEHADGILNSYGREDEETDIEELIAGGGNDSGSDHDDGGDRDDRERRNHAFKTLVAENLVNDEAERDRKQNDLNDREEHRHRVDVEPLVREDVHEGRRRKGREERRT